MSLFHVDPDLEALVTWWNDETRESKLRLKTVLDPIDVCSEALHVNTFDFEKQIPSNN